MKWRVVVNSWEGAVCISVPHSKFCMGGSFLPFATALTLLPVSDQHNLVLVLVSVLSALVTARRSYASAVLGVVILSVRMSVCPSVCLSHACFVTNPKNLPAIFLYHMKGQSF